MKLNKKIFWINVSITSLEISILLSFAIEKTEVTECINRILLNIFIGKLVLFITSLYEYLMNRKEVLENIMLQCLKFIKLFDKIEYLMIETLLNMSNTKINKSYK